MRETLDAWLQEHKKPTIYGIAFGALWGFLTAATVTYREWLFYDQLHGIVYKFSDLALSPQKLLFADFVKEYNDILVQGTLLLFFLSGFAGWSTWQLTRVRPRGEDQPTLHLGTDWYLIGYAISGFLAVVLFRFLGMAAWFKGNTLNIPVIIRSALGFLLPLYAGVALFLVWFRRLKSIRAPDRDSRKPKPSKRKKSGAFKGRHVRQKGDRQRK